MNCCNPAQPDAEKSLLLSPIKSTLKEVDENTDSQPEPANEKKSGNKSELYGYVCAFTGRFGMISGLALSQALDRTLPHSQLNGFRYSFQWLVTVSCLICTGKLDVRVSKEFVGWVCVSSVMSVASAYATYGQSFYLPLGVSSGSVCTLQICIVYFLSFLLHRSIHIDQIAAAIICFIGALFVTQPAFIFHNTQPSLIHANETFSTPCRVMAGNRTNFSMYFSNGSSSWDHPYNTNQRSTTQDDIIGYSLVVVEAIANAVHITILKHKLHTFDPLVYLFWVSIVGVVLSYCIMGAFETPTLPDVRGCIIIMVFHVIISGTHNFALVQAYQVLAPNINALITALQIPGLFILQYTLLSGLYPGHANPLEISGAIIVFIGTVSVPSIALMRSCQ